MNQITLHTTNPAALTLLEYLNDQPAIYHELVHTQDEAIAAGEPPLPIPVIWLALLNVAGFTVDPATGQIVDGPEDPVPGLGLGIAYRPGLLLAHAMRLEEQETK